MEGARSGTGSGISRSKSAKNQLRHAQSLFPSAHRPAQHPDPCLPHPHKPSSGSMDSCTLARDQPHQLFSLAPCDVYQANGFRS